MSPSKTKRRDAGEGSVYQRKDGMWIGSLELGWGADGKRRRKVVSSKDKATAIAKLRALRRQLDEHGDLPTASMTLERWLTHWLDQVAARRVRPRTLANYRYLVTKYVIPALGRHRLDRLAPQHVRALETAMTGAGLSTTSAQQAYRILSKALTDAQREGHLTRNPAALVDAPRTAVSDRGALTATEGIALLASVAGDPLGPRWAAALLTGARQGELLGLQRDRVGDVLDLSWQLQRLGYRHGCRTRGADRNAPYACGQGHARSCPARELDVPAGFEHRPLDGGLVLTRPKTKAGHRVIPLVEPLRTILARHLEATAPGPHGLVWSREGGRPIDPRDDSAAWHAALKAAELPRVPLHAARHTSGTLLLAAGVPIDVIGAIMGHSSVASTRTYLHVDQTLKAKALEALSLALTPAPQDHSPIARPLGA